MENLLYIIAVILIIGWAVGFFFTQWVQSFIFCLFLQLLR